MSRFVLRALHKYIRELSYLSGEQHLLWLYLCWGPALAKSTPYLCHTRHKNFHWIFTQSTGVSEHSLKVFKYWEHSTSCTDLKKKSERKALYVNLFVKLVVKAHNSLKTVNFDTKWAEIHSKNSLLKQKKIK